MNHMVLIEQSSIEVIEKITFMQSEASGYGGLVMAFLVLLLCFAALGYGVQREISKQPFEEDEEELIEEETPQLEVLPEADVEIEEVMEDEPVEEIPPVIEEAPIPEEVLVPPQPVKKKKKIFGFSEVPTGAMVVAWDDASGHSHLAEVKNISLNQVIFDANNFNADTIVEISCPRLDLSFHVVRADLRNIEDGTVTLGLEEFRDNEDSWMAWVELQTRIDEVR
ncbi:hypothetical protein [Candidatus Terasakiella magnetica]|nr:hypothetical protein [Candidatus Terasakiella magnetica]